MVATSKEPHGLNNHISEICRLCLLHVLSQKLRYFRRGVYFSFCQKYELVGEYDDFFKANLRGEEVEKWGKRVNFHCTYGKNSLFWKWGEGQTFIPVFPVKSLTIENIYWGTVMEPLTSTCWSLCYYRLPWMVGDYSFGQRCIKPPPPGPFTVVHG